MALELPQNLIKCHAFISNKPTKREVGWKLGPLFSDTRYKTFGFQ